MQKPLQFQLLLEQALGGKRPAAKLNQRNCPVCSVERADGTKEARDVIKYVAQVLTLRTELIVSQHETGRAAAAAPHRQRNVLVH